MEFIAELNIRTNDPKVAGAEIRKALENSKVVHIKSGWHISNLREHYDVITEEVGKCIMIGEDFTVGGKQTGEKWIEIRYDNDIPDIAAYRHSKNAQPLHTDESYIEDFADIMFFYCINKAEIGGATTFVDGPVLIDFMRKTNPDLLNKLVGHDIKYKKADEERVSPIIWFDKNNIPRFNFNYYCIDHEETVENKALNKEFFDFLQNYVVGTYMIKEICLNPGDAVAWWDDAVLHGRTAFSANKTNDRFIWKAGIKFT
ncbi:MAG: TauD/TfdA family dioxygenase [Bacteroidota bacterium]